MKKRRMESFVMYDAEGVEKHLEKMAKKGYFLTKVGRSFWTYERREPKEVRYAVGYFPDASDFDPGPTRSQATYQDFCSAAGWQFVGQWSQMQIFYNENPDAVPLETDEQTKLSITAKAMKKGFLPATLLVIVCCLIELGIGVNRVMDDFLYETAAYFSVWFLFIWVWILLLMVWMLADYGVWYFRSKHQVAEGGSCFHGGSNLRKWVQRVFVWVTMLSVFTLYHHPPFGTYAVLLLLLFPVMMLHTMAIDGLRNWMRKRDVSRGTNRVVTFLVHVVTYVLIIFLVSFGIVQGIKKQEEPPAQVVTLTNSRGQEYDWEVYDDPLLLTLADLGLEEEGEIYSSTSDHQSSFLMEYEKGREEWVQSGEADVTLIYKKATNKMPFFDRQCAQALLVPYRGEYAEIFGNPRYVPADATLWNADLAYQQISETEGVPMEQFVVVKGKTFVWVYFPVVPTESQIKIAAEKLLPSR